MRAMGRGVRAMGRGVRAMSRGVRAMGRGVGAMSRGVRAMGGGVRAMGWGQGPRLFFPFPGMALQSISSRMLSSRSASAFGSGSPRTSPLQTDPPRARLRLRRDVVSSARGFLSFPEPHTLSSSSKAPFASDLSQQRSRCSRPCWCSERDSSKGTTLLIRSLKCSSCRVISADRLISCFSVEALDGLPPPALAFRPPLGRRSERVDPPTISVGRPKALSAATTEQNATHASPRGLPVLQSVRNCSWNGATDKRALYTCARN